MAGNNWTQSSKPKLRKHIRFKPDEGSNVQIDFASQNQPFKPSLTGLLFSEAYGGCGFVCLPDESLQIGRFCRVQVGRIGPLEAEIVWISKIDSDVFKVGLKYRE